jgi:Leucine-rich repeat (LRR) protein
MAYQVIDGVLDLSHKKLKEIPKEIFDLMEITKLDLSFNQLTSLPPEIGKLVNLEGLDVSDNRLTSLPSEIWKLVNLKELWVSHNQLTSLPSAICDNQTEFDGVGGIGKLVNLIDLSVSDNRLTSLPSDIGKLVNLENFFVSDNQLTSLPSAIGELINLEKLVVSNNQLASLPSEIGKLVNLKELSVEGNQLTSIPSEIGELVNLEELDVSHNKLTSLPSEIGLLRNLIYLFYSNNPIEYIPPQVQRLIDRLRKNGQEVYRDKQSVHNSGIQTSFKETVLRLSNKKPKLNIDQTVEEILMSSLLDDSKSSIIDYCSSKDIHSELNMTYSELLVLVWDRIRNHCYRKEILKVLDTELTDSECKCFTGRITRLVNCLNGFDTDVIIGISDNEQLSNLMVLINNKYDNIEDKKQELIKAMKERGFSQEKIDEWVGYID